MEGNENKLLAYGRCCNDLREALNVTPTEDVSNFFFVGDNGMLHIYTASARLAEGKAALFSNAVHFCPFCGEPTALPDKAKAKH